MATKIRAHSSFLWLFSTQATKGKGGHETWANMVRVSGKASAWWPCGCPVLLGHCWVLAKLCFSLLVYPLSCQDGYKPAWMPMPFLDIFVRNWQIIHKRVQLQTYGWYQSVTGIIILVVKGDIFQRAQTSRCKMSKSEDIIYSMVKVKRVDLKWSRHHHTTTKIITTWGVGCVKEPHCGNHLAIYTCIKLSHCTP